MTATMTRAAAPALQRPRHRALAPALIGLLGFAISAVGIGIPSVWYDEAATISSATRSWPQLWAELGNVDAVHGLYYALMHLVFDLFGYSPVTLRMPSAIAVGAAAALVVVLGRQLSRPRLGIIAGLVFVVIPRVIWAGGEGRSYAMTTLLAVALTVVFVAARSTSRRRWWFGYAALAALACVLFLYLALIVVAHGVALAWRLARRDRLAPFFGRRWLLAAGGAAVVTAPVALEIMSQSGQVAWIKPIGPDTVSQVLVTQWFTASVPLAIAAWSLILVGIVSLVRRGDRAALTILLPALVLPTVALIAISAVHAPLYQPRYLTLCTPFAALVIAAGIDAVRWRFAAASGLVLLLALAAPQLVAQRMPEAKDNSSWSQVAALIAAERAADGPGTTTAFLYGNVQRHPGATARVIAYSYPEAFAGGIDPMLLTPAAETAQLWETRAPIGQSTSRLLGADVAYLITSNARDLRGETTAALARVGWRAVDAWDFTAVHVVKYERSTTG